MNYTPLCEERLNLFVRRLTDFSLDIEVEDVDGEPYDFEGCVGEAVLRRSYDSEVVLSLDVLLGAGFIRLSKSAGDLDIDELQYVWDFKLTKGSGEVERWLHGKVGVGRKVT